MPCGTKGVVGSTEAFEDKIEPMWTGVRPSGTTSTKWLTDWIARLVFKAELTNSGRSKRQIARRIKSWAGVSERDLHGIGHSEQLFAKLHEAMQMGDLDWAELAAEAGFADQAHMIRRMRQYTGFTPEQFRQSAGNDEAFWGYRLLRQYFTKQEGQ
jgi:AraC-like DNA-binding protein